MVKTSFGNTSFGLGSRDVGLASLLSILPGLGQIYNGQVRKGFLFFATTASYLFVFSLIVFNDALVKGLNTFGQAFHMQPDNDLICALCELHAGSSISFLVTGLFVAFIAYAIRDASQYAISLRNRYIYADQALEMTEAASGSYLLHFTAIVFLFFIATFFLQHTQRQTQVTYIEFVQDQLPTKTKVVTSHVSTHLSKSSGQHDDKQPVSAPSHSGNISKAIPQFKPTFHPMLNRLNTPVMPHQQLANQTITPPKISAPSSQTNNTPSPIKPTTISKSNQGTAPQPTFTQKNHAGTIPLPKLDNGIAIPIGSNAPPGPRTTATAGGKNTPVPIGDFGHPPGHTTGQPLIEPIPARSFNNGIPGTIVKPSIPGAIGPTTDNAIGNPEPSSLVREAPSIPTSLGPPDFSAYMADLQRRIKRAWFPPHGKESIRVEALFKIHKGGQLSDLRLKKSCGDAEADKAALNAIENAAPFRSLPTGAPEDVDIQFTFDYNIFNGTSKLFRNF